MIAGTIPMADYRLRLQAMNQLARRLQEVVEVLTPHFPLDSASFDQEALDRQGGLAVDAFRIRYADLQDLVGRSLFEALALADGSEAPGDEVPASERIAAMQRRGLLTAERWYAIREVRNRFAHQHPEDLADKADNLNAAWRQTPELLAVVERIRDYAARRHGVTA